MENCRREGETILFSFHAEEMECGCGVNLEMNINISFEDIRCLFILFFFVLSLRILTRFVHCIFLQFALFILANTDGCVMWLPTMEWTIWVFSRLLLHCEPIKWHLLFFRLNRTLNTFAVHSHTHIEECVCDIPIREWNWSDSHWNSFKMHWNQYYVKFAKRYECFRKADGFDTFECSRKLISFHWH